MIAKPAHLSDGGAVITFHSMNPIKPLPSWYAGCRFRSRLEARWAYYFDLIGMKWEYEPEGYWVNGAGYCPDFFSAPGDFFVEVKPNRQEMEIARPVLAELAWRTGKSVFCAVGQPTTQPQIHFHPTIVDCSDASFLWYAFTRKGWSDPFYTNDSCDGFYDADERCVVLARTLRFENGVAHPRNVKVLCDF